MIDNTTTVTAFIYQMDPCEILLHVKSGNFMRIVLFDVLQYICKERIILLPIMSLGIKILHRMDT